MTITKLDAAGNGFGIIGDAVLSSSTLDNQEGFVLGRSCA
jgi:hypothetical protein